MKVRNGQRSSWTAYITNIQVSGGGDGKAFSRNYSVYLRPGETMFIGNHMPGRANPVVPFGDYEIIVTWSDGPDGVLRIGGKRTLHNANISIRSGTEYNLNYGIHNDMDRK